MLTEWSADLGSVPPIASGYTCECCLGPVTTYRQCPGCHATFHVAGAPVRLKGRIVPMTSALNPSRWYSALASYKGFQPGLGVVLASVAHHFLHSRATQIRNLLGSDPDLITIVPSKRGITYAAQSLRAALSLIEPIARRLRQTLSHVEGQTVPRRGYNPAAFAPSGTGVTGMRILLVEDAWVSGATALSAAGALLDAGATDVLIMPIARVIDQGFWPDDHPYRIAMRKPWDPDDASAWPR